MVDIDLLMATLEQLNEVKRSTREAIKELEKSKADAEKNRLKEHCEKAKRKLSLENEVEIELDTIKLDEIDDEGKNNNFNNLRKQKE